MDITFKVENQFVERTDYTKLVARTTDYIYAEFIFSTEWEGFEKTAQFTRDTDTYNVLIVDDKCKIPWEIMQTAGRFTVSVFGGDLFTTAGGKVNVIETGYIRGGSFPVDPTPSYFTDIALAEDGRVIAETGRDDAEDLRVIAETGRDDAEIIRLANEIARILAEGDRDDAEIIRLASEIARLSAETDRNDAEIIRLSSEISRVNAESDRVIAETNRDDAEIIRLSSEIDRNDAEVIRLASEIVRVDSEIERNDAEEIGRAHV